MYASSSSVNPTPLAHADTQRDVHLKGDITSCLELTRQDLVQDSPLDLDFFRAKQIGESLVIWMEAMRPSEDAGKKSVDSGRFQRHDGGSRPNSASHWED
ncbi:hypothetical protein TNCV_952791 [Trichonephila clavipes]|nr:hypothetical protein TNCV_952791 [Trichonephila clavipes]